MFIVGNSQAGLAAIEGLVTRRQRAGCQGRLGADVHPLARRGTIGHHAAAQASPRHRSDGDRCGRFLCTSTVQLQNRHQALLQADTAVGVLGARNKTRHTRCISHLHLLAPVPAEGQWCAVCAVLQDGTAPPAGFSLVLGQLRLWQSTGHQQPTVVGHDANALPARIGQLLNPFDHLIQLGVEVAR